jgi:hypothetical protein
MVSVWAERSEYVATRQVLTQNVTWLVHACEEKAQTYAMAN